MMLNLRLAIVDDESLARERARRLLAKVGGVDLKVTDLVLRYLIESPDDVVERPRPKRPAASPGVRAKARR